MRDFHTAPISDQDQAMLLFAEALTKSPGMMRKDQIDDLRAAGFCDTAIHDITQVTALFNYYNRLADGLGIKDEPEWSDQEQESNT